MPTESIELEYVYGYQGKRGRSNLYLLPSKEVCLPLIPSLAH
jgi:hypothetical protein